MSLRGQAHYEGLQDDVGAAIEAIKDLLEQAEKALYTDCPEYAAGCLSEISTCAVEGMTSAEEMSRLRGGDA